jgi:hypothetical protein
MRNRIEQEERAAIAVALFVYPFAFLSGGRAANPPRLANFQLLNFDES